MLVCAECGSTNIQVLAWVDANTNEYKGDNGESTCWCEDCEEEQRMTTQEDFLESKRESEIDYE